MPDRSADVSCDCENPSHAVGKARAVHTDSARPFTSIHYAQIAMLCGKHDVAVSKQILMASRMKRVYRLPLAHFYLFCCSDRGMYGIGPLSASHKDFCAGSPFPRKKRIIPSQLFGNHSPPPVQLILGTRKSFCKRLDGMIGQKNCREATSR